jgi:S-DNA-T family DNA segregation ATPase FtsK/SpoIIIE
MVLENLDDKFDEAMDMVIRTQNASQAILMRELSINFGRSMQILKQLEMIGVVSKAEPNKPRKVLIRLPDEIRW